MILHGLGELLSAFEMHGQSRGNLPTVFSISCLFAPTNTLMHSGLAGGWDTFVDDVLIEGMTEPVARGHRPVRPGVDATRLQKLPTARQRFTPRLRLHHVGVEARRDR